MFATSTVYACGRQGLGQFACNTSLCAGCCWICTEQRLALLPGCTLCVVGIYASGLQCVQPCVLQRCSPLCPLHPLLLSLPPAHPLSSPTSRPSGCRRSSSRRSGSCLWATWRPAQSLRPACTRCSTRHSSQHSRRQHSRDRSPCSRCAGRGGRAVGAGCAEVCCGTQCSLAVPLCESLALSVLARQGPALHATPLRHRLAHHPRMRAAATRPICCVLCR